MNGEARSGWLFRKNRTPADGVAPAKTLSRKERKKIQQQRKLANCGSASSRTSWLAAVVRWLVYVFGVIASLVALVGLFPQFSVSRELPLDATDPFTTFFVLRYETLVPVFDVDVSCHINEIRQEKYISIQNFDTKVEGIHIGSMWQGDEITVSCLPVKAANLKVVQADVVLRVRFRPIVWLRLSKREFRFLTFTQADGNLRWFPETKEYQ
jgi:hypothetical protein